MAVNASAASQRIQSADIKQNAGATGGGQTSDASVQAALATQCASLFTGFCRHRAEIKLVTFWGVTDADSWRRNGHPPLFEMQGKPIPAFQAVLETARSQHE